MDKLKKQFLRSYILSSIDKVWEERKEGYKWVKATYERRI